MFFCLLRAQCGLQVKRPSRQLGFAARRSIRAQRSTDRSGEFLLRKFATSRRPIKPEELRKSLDRLDQGDADSESLIRELLDQSGVLGALSEARRVHAHVVKAGLDQDTFIANKLVQMYGRCGGVDDACRVFERIKWKNDHSYNAMIAAYSQNGDLDPAKQIFAAIPQPGVLAWNFMILAFARNGSSREAIYCFWKMNAEGVHPNTYSFVALLDACARIEALEEGMLVHDLVVREGLEAEGSIRNALVSFYRKCGRLDQARKVFDKITLVSVSLWTQMFAAYAKFGQLQEARDLFDRMPEKDAISWTCIVTAYAQRGRWAEAEDLFKRMPDRDLIAWNSMISAYAQNGNFRGALRLLPLMDLDGIQPNNVTFLSILDACAGSGAVFQGLKIYESSIAGTGIERCLSVANALMNMFGKCKELPKAKAIFDGMSQRDVISWTCMVSSYTDNGDLVNAKLVLERMPEKHLMARVTMVVGYAQNGLLDEAKTSYDELQHPDVVGWTAMIIAYAQNGLGKEAFGLLKAGDLEGLQTDLVSFVGILDACACCGAQIEGSLIHAEVLERGMDDDPAVGCAVVNMYGKFGQVGAARRSFDVMPFRNAVTWNAMLTAYAQNGHSKRTLELFPWMGLEGVYPTEITFIAILSACAQAGLLETGHKQFLSMRQDYELVPRSENFVCMVDLLGRAGRLEAAEELSKTMPVKERRTAWTALLGSCKLHGDSNRGARAAEKVVTLDPDTSAPYALLSEAYVCR